MALYGEADAIMLKFDPTSLLPFVSCPIVGTEFREILAAICSRDMKIDGMPLFPPGMTTMLDRDKLIAQLLAMLADLGWTPPTGDAIDHLIDRGLWRRR